MREQTLARRLLLTAILTPILAAAAVGSGQTRPSGPAPARPSTPSAIERNPAAGKAIFDGPGKCLTCHQAGASGSVVGPNLSNIGAELSPDRLRQWLLNPAQTIEPQNRLYEIVIPSGKTSSKTSGKTSDRTIRGKLLNQDPSSLQMLDSSGQLVAFSRSQVRDGHFVDPPPMPSYQGQFTSAQIDDLVAYLGSLRVPENQ